jgi:succinate-semialdehyde dehydrogenase/glutarate-semialdehyde dehydrogenase
MRHSSAPADRVVAAFSPWNFPTSSPARKVGGALSAGCSIILKASEETPAGAVQLVKAFADAGLPPGVLNLVFGKPAEISEYLIPQPAVRLVTFTGSVPVGKHLTAFAGAHEAGYTGLAAARQLARAGASVLVIERERVGWGASSRNAGQVCVSPTRFFCRGRDLRPVRRRLCPKGQDDQGRQRTGSRQPDGTARQ